MLSIMLEIYLIFVPVLKIALVVGKTEKNFSAAMPGACPGVVDWLVGEVEAKQ
jgi:hypothetical protein